MASSSTFGVSALTASFLPVVEASVRRTEEQNSVSRAVGASAEQQIQSGITSAAAKSNDVAGAVLTGRGQKMDISA
jgi:hypothetical protein